MRVRVPTHLVMNSPIQIFPLLGLPEIARRDDVAAAILDAIGRQRFELRNGDILVVAQKIVSKAEGRIVALTSVTPSPRALSWARDWGKDARVIELVLRETKRIVRMERGVIISETQHGFICANAGVDVSNAPEGTAILLPEDPDASARSLRAKLSKSLGVDLGIIISDTFGRAWREALVNVALGVAGLPSLIDYRGECDTHGRPLQATVIALADELASSAELVMGKSERIPVAIIRGVQMRNRDGSGRDLIRPADKDLFR